MILPSPSQMLFILAGTQAQLVTGPLRAEYLGALGPVALSPPGPWLALCFTWKMGADN